MEIQISWIWTGSNSALRIFKNVFLIAEQAPDWLFTGSSLDVPRSVDVLRHEALLFIWSQ